MRRAHSERSSDTLSSAGVTKSDLDGFVHSVSEHDDEYGDERNERGRGMASLGVTRVETGGQLSSSTREK